MTSARSPACAPSRSAPAGATTSSSWSTPTTALTGLGEASLGGQTHAVLGAIKDLEPLLLGADPFRIEHLWQQAYRHAFWHGGVDLPQRAGRGRGRALGHQGPGARRADPPPARRSGPRPDPRLRQRPARRHARTSWPAPRPTSSPAGSPRSRWRPSRRCRSSPARRLIDAGVAKVRAVREAVGPDVELMIDAHGRLSPRGRRRARRRRWRRSASCSSRSPACRSTSRR